MESDHTTSGLNGVAAGGPGPAPSWEDWRERIRAVQSDPVLLELYANLAADVLSAATNNAATTFDGEFFELDAEQRTAYVAAQSEALAHALRRAGLAWAVLEMEPVASWLERISPP